MRKYIFFEKFMNARPSLLRALSLKMQHADAEDALQDVCVYWLETHYWNKVNPKNLTGLFWTSAVRSALNTVRAQERQEQRDKEFYELQDNVAYLCKKNPDEGTTRQVRTQVSWAFSALGNEEQI